MIRLLFIVLIVSVLCYVLYKFITTHPTKLKIKKNKLSKNIKKSTLFPPPILNAAKTRFMIAYPFLLTSQTSDLLIKIKNELYITPPYFIDIILDRGRYSEKERTQLAELRYKYIQSLKPKSAKPKQNINTVNEFTNMSKDLDNL